MYSKDHFRSSPQQVGEVNALAPRQDDGASASEVKLDGSPAPQRPIHRSSSSGPAIYEQIPPTALVDTLPEIGALWTRMIVDAEQGAFVPPLIQEHDLGILVNASDLYTQRELTPGEDVCARLAEGRILELGAGFGRVSRVLREKGLEVVTTDSDQTLVEMYRARGWSDAEQVTLPDIPSSIGRFDTVIALRGVLGLAGELDDVCSGLRRIVQLLNPGGRLIFTSSRVNTLLLFPDRSPLEYRYRYLYRGCRTPWLRATALPEWLALPILRDVGFTDIETFASSPSDGAGYYALARL